VAVAPDGGLDAREPTNHRDDGYVTVELAARRTGEARAINTGKRPVAYDAPRWSKDSKRLLLTPKTEIKQDDWRTAGFIVVDVAAGIAQIGRLDDESIQNDDFFWNDDRPR